MSSPELDINGLMKAFADTDRQDFEYLLDTYTGRVHFVPLAFLQLADEGKLDAEKYEGQKAERAQVALEYADDIEGRYELIPFVDPDAEEEWKADFLNEQGIQEIGPQEQLAWSTYKAERLQDEAVGWVEEIGLLEDDTDY